MAVGYFWQYMMFEVKDLHQQNFLQGHRRTPRRLGAKKILRTEDVEFDKVSCASVLWMHWHFICSTFYNLSINMTCSDLPEPV